MGQAQSFGLTQYDVDEVQEHCQYRFSQQEVLLLYKRFRQLDRAKKGFLASEELLSIPELSVNPLASAVVHAFESVNFKEFVRLLSAFSRKATRHDKLAFMFELYDVDGDGIISAGDIELMLRQMAGSSLSDGQIKRIIVQVEAQAAKWEGGLDLDGFIAALEGREITMTADLPDADY